MANKSSLNCRLMLAVLVLTLVALVAGAKAYNDDRPIYKWSPLWFNHYIRRGVLHKRVNDDSPMYKWSPLFLDRENYKQLLHLKRGSCLPEWALCGPGVDPCCMGSCEQGTCLGTRPGYVAYPAVYPAWNS